MKFATKRNNANPSQHRNDAFAEKGGRKRSHDDIVSKQTDAAKLVRGARRFSFSAPKLKQLNPE
jgi:hypothetical protein